MASVDLDLRGQPGGTDLDLGASGADDRTAAIAATTAAPSAAIHAGHIYLAAVAATTAAPRASVSADYDPNLLSDVVSLASEAWASGAAHGGAAQICIRPAERRGLTGKGAWSPGSHVGGLGRETWAQAERADTAGKSAWLDALLRSGDTREAWHDGERFDGLGREQWRDGERQDHASRDAWTSPYHLGTVRNPSWGTQPPLQTLDLRADAEDGLRLSPGLRQCWRDGGLVAYVFRLPDPPYVPPWEHWGNDLCLLYPLPGGLLDLGIRPCPGGGTEPPEPPVGGVIPRRRTYMILHDVTVVRLPDRLPISISALSISLDAEAWAWSWSGTLLGAAALDAVLPVDDEPVTLEADIDGYLWHLLVEEWSEDRTFGNRAIRASGRGLTAWLAAPYQLPGSGVLANDRTIQQLMDEQLPVGEGWTLVWRDGTPDWLVPAGAWSWAQRTPMQAIHEAALGVGLIVMPDRTARELHVLSRYPVLPWDYAAADPDLVVPYSALLQLTRRRQADAQANAVYVHGGEVGGVLARVYRTGSAGDRLANTESSPLITHADGARLLGSRILAAHESQPEVRSFTLPLGGDFPLAELGQLVEVELSASDTRGTISGLEVAVARAGRDALTVRQTITIGEEAPNLWARFRSLLPADPLLAGEVTIVHGDGTVTVALIGGGTIRVRGVATEGDMVYVRGDRIDGAAPELTGIEIDV